MTAFIQAANGNLLPIDSIDKLHVGQGYQASSVFADTSLIGSTATGGDPQTLLENLAVRAASTHGVFGIREGAVYRRHIIGETKLQTENYGTGENAAWASRA